MDRPKPSEAAGKPRKGAGGPGTNRLWTNAFSKVRSGFGGREGEHLPAGTTLTAVGPISLPSDPVHLSSYVGGRIETLQTSVAPGSRGSAVPPPPPQVQRKLSAPTDFQSHLPPPGPSPSISNQSPQLLPPKVTSLPPSARPAGPPNHPIISPTSSQHYHSYAPPPLNRANSSPAVGEPADSPSPHASGLVRKATTAAGLRHIPPATGPNVAIPRRTSSTPAPYSPRGSPHPTSRPLPEFTPAPPAAAGPPRTTSASDEARREAARQYLRTELHGRPPLPEAIEDDDFDDDSLEDSEDDLTDEELLDEESRNRRRLTEKHTEFNGEVSNFRAENGLVSMLRRTAKNVNRLRGTSDASQNSTHTPERGRTTLKLRVSFAAQPRVIGEGAGWFSSDDEDDEDSEEEEDKKDEEDHPDQRGMPAAEKPMRDSDRGHNNGPAAGSRENIPPPQESVPAPADPRSYYQSYQSSTILPDRSADPGHRRQEELARTAERLSGSSSRAEPSEPSGLVRSVAAEPTTLPADEGETNNSQPATPPSAPAAPLAAPASPSPVIRPAQSLMSSVDSGADAGDPAPGLGLRLSKLMREAETWGDQSGSRMTGAEYSPAAAEDTSFLSYLNHIEPSDVSVTSPGYAPAMERFLPPGDDTPTRPTGQPVTSSPLTRPVDTSAAVKGPAVDKPSPLPSPSPPHAEGYETDATEPSPILLARRVTAPTETYELDTLLRGTLPATTKRCHTYLQQLRDAYSTLERGLAQAKEEARVERQQAQQLRESLTASRQQLDHLASKHHQHLKGLKVEHQQMRREVDHWRHRAGRGPTSPGAAGPYPPASTSAMPGGPYAPSKVNPSASNSSSNSSTASATYRSNSGSRNAPPMGPVSPPSSTSHATNPGRYPSSRTSAERTRPNPAGPPVGASRGYPGMSRKAQAGYF